ncbi:MAG: hypothetical protein J6I97_09430 [Agathobacter sp.]|nr:hypothetical protein [Agathobacter sp.]
MRDIKQLVRVDVTFHEVITDDGDDVTPLTDYHVSALFHPDDISEDEVKSIVTRDPYQTLSWLQTGCDDNRLIVLPTKTAETFRFIMNT